MVTRVLSFLGAATLLMAAAAPAPARVTDDQVVRAINRGKEWLISQQQGDGSFHQNRGDSCLAFMTLAYMGMHPNRTVMSKALDYHMNLDPDVDFDGGAGSHNARGYTLPIRLMGLSYVHNKLLGKKRDRLRRRMYEDVERLRFGQATTGGWRYALEPNNDWDFSNSQFPILAFREANLVGIEVPPEPLFKARELYYAEQNQDGGYHYQTGDKSYGSMTAAGLASLYIIQDLLEPGSGCPCRGGHSPRTTSETDRRIDRALQWLSENFQGAANPQADGTPGSGRTHYWLYCVERVGIAAGYKYFGRHDWYAEGADFLVRSQGGAGNWSGKHGTMVDTCFSLLFLYKGRAPVLFNKVRFDGLWNQHRRDINNLTRYIERIKEQPFHWQIMELQAPLEELHEAPILYITAESVPNWGEPEKQKLRAFTDTGGTVLFEASCGNSEVKRWFRDFARDLWPEWRMKPLGPEHGVYTDPYPLKKRPELLGINDGMRTSVIFAIDDISCPWHTKAYASRAYLFQWGINLLAYATDRAELKQMRAKLSEREDIGMGRYGGPVRAGPKTSLRVARVRHSGNWEVNANYGGLRKLAEHVRNQVGVTVEVNEPSGKPYTTGGVAPADLSGYDAAYITGSEEFAFTSEEQAALKQYVDGGGFLLLEAAHGAPEFDQSFQTLAKAMGWEVRLLPTTHGLVTGRMDRALGYNMASDVAFRKALRFIRAGRRYAEFLGVFKDGRMVGVYSPLDIVFSSTPYEAYMCHGYRPPDARAAATNLMLYLTTRGQ